MGMRLFDILEIIGTVAFAVSGAMVAIQKKLDIVGVLFLGVLAAVGGGALRDLMLGIAPPQCFQNPKYLVIACVTAFLFFLPFVRRPLLKRQRTFDLLLLWMDSLGLAVFSVSGVETGLSSQPEASPILLVFVGVLTGTGGGVMRDVLAGDKPMVFVKHVYATASLVGSVLFLVMKALGASWHLSAIVVLVVVFTIRCLAAHYHWNLPRAED